MPSQKPKTAQAACTVCHASKRKCDGNLPCGRCVRLGKEWLCERYQSKQGQRQKSASGNNKLDSNNNKRQKTTQSTSSSSNSRVQLSGPSEVAALSNQLFQQDNDQDDEDVNDEKDIKEAAQSTTKSTSTSSQTNQTTNRFGNHYGFLYLVRSWISFAIRRRSFSLLARASDVAVRCGIDMDKILHETQHEAKQDNQSQQQKGMEFLHNILLRPQQQVTGTRLAYHELPSPLCVATDFVCPPTYSTNGNTDTLWMKDRLIWIREMDQGKSRYFLTPAFERHLASWQQINQTFQANQLSVVDLFLGANDSKIKHTKAFAHQISLYPTCTSSLKLTRLSQVQLQTRHNTLITVDQISCLLIANLDQAFYFIEYVRRDPHNRNSSASTKEDPTTKPLSKAVRIKTNNNNNNPARKKAKKPVVISSTATIQPTITTPTATLIPNSNLPMPSISTVASAHAQPFPIIGNPALALMQQQQQQQAAASAAPPHIFNHHHHHHNNTMDEDIPSSFLDLDDLTFDKDLESILESFF